MALSKQNAEKLKWLWRDENKIEWIGAFIKIADKTGKTVPFILTNEQRAFVNGLEHKNIVSKSRQLGLSVVTCALALRECVVSPNKTCILISHSQESTNKVFEKLKNMYYSLPEWLRPKTIMNNRQALQFTNGSSITCATSGNKDVGRGATINGICHLSEFAMWKRQDEQIQSVMQACTDSATIIIESTTKGYNKFSEMYLQARNKENDFKPFFFNFINGRELFEPQYKQAVKTYMKLHDGEMLTEDEYDEEEKHLATLGMTPDQAVWRRSKIAESSLDAFHEEFPSTFEESVLSTGASVFDKTRVNSVLISIQDKKLKPLDIKALAGLPTILRAYVTNKSLKIWKIPRPGVKYHFGVDCAEGLKQDSTTIICLDKDGEMVMQFKNNAIEPYLFADVLDCLGRWYNKALLTVEKASSGHSVISKLRYEKNYYNMTKYKSYDEYNREVWQVGFDTNAKSKSIAVNDAREWFDRGMIKIVSPDLLDEMKVFSANERGQMSAPPGYHDDLVMALCLCIVGLKKGYWYPF